MTKKEWNVATHALEQVAQNNGTTIEVVREEIKAAIAEAMKSDDQAVRDQWRFVPCSGEVPTPEEFIMYVANRVGRKQENRT